MSAPGLRRGQSREGAGWSAAACLPRRPCALGRCAEPTGLRPHTGGGQCVMEMSPELGNKGSAGSSMAAPASCI